MKTSCLSAALTVAMPSLVIFATWFRNTRTRLFAVALAVVILAPISGQSAPRVLFYGPNDSTESSYLPTNATLTVASETTWRAMTTSEFAHYDYHW